MNLTKQVHTPPASWDSASHSGLGYGCNHTPAVPLNGPCTTAGVLLMLTLLFITPWFTHMSKVRRPGMAQQSAARLELGHIAHSDDCFAQCFAQHACKGCIRCYPHSFATAGALSTPLPTIFAPNPERPRRHHHSGGDWPV